MGEVAETRRLILASSSPRRQALLEGLGVTFGVVAPEVDELRYPDEEPYDYVERIARNKAEAVSIPGAVVVAADTSVVVDGQILGKPAHPEEARAMLRRLSDQTHEVLTGVAVTVDDGTAETVAEVASALVRFLPMTEEEIADYVASGEPMDKAGAYALNGRAALYIESIQGSPSGVIGLPLHIVARLLRTAGCDLLSFVGPEPADPAWQSPLPDA